jgi:aldehyde dehydrogenase (NAD+)
VDLDPFTGSVLVRTPVADRNDLDDAFEAAARAQPDWERTLPTERAAVLRRAAATIEARRGEIVEWWCPSSR